MAKRGERFAMGIEKEAEVVMIVWLGLRVRLGSVAGLWWVAFSSLFLFSEKMKREERYVEWAC